MYRNLLFILITFLLASCSASTNFVLSPQYKINDFDLSVMRAHTYEYYEHYKEARDEFLALYQDYNASSFLEHAFLLTLANDLDKKEELNELSKTYKDNDNLKRLSILYALQANKLRDAQKLAQDLLARKDNDPINLELYGDILARKNDLKNAIKYYRLAYDQVQNEELLFKLIGVWALLNDTLSIKNILESSRKTKSCTIKTCVLLAKIYFDEKNFKGLEELYKELYELSYDKSFILVLIGLLNSQDKTQEALDLALRYDLDAKIKLALYERLKRFDEASKMSLKLYGDTKDKEYLLKSAVFEFEGASASKTLTPKIIHSVKAKFEKGIQKQSNALYLNYYGYLLIDYDLDVKKGIKFVKLALEKEPHNLYYLDSLAWGYYKLGLCAKAWELLNPLKELASSNELKAHIKAIKACINHDK